jgi:DNA-binding NarL/FixJ family response regulator
MKVLIVDDHPMVREALGQTLKSFGGDVEVMEAQDGEEALGWVEKHPDLDLVLLDLELPGSDGASVLQSLRHRDSALPVIIISGSDDRAHVLMALRMGASGFIPKSHASGLVLQAVRLVLSGGVYIPPSALDIRTRSADTPVLSIKQRPVGTVDCANITERQKEVLALLALGRPNKIIAAELDISETTVKAHITAILRALKVSNRAQAIVAARQIGFG